MTSELEIARDHVDRALEHLENADGPTLIKLLAGLFLVFTRLVLQSGLEAEREKES